MQYCLPPVYPLYIYPCHHLSYSKSNAPNKLKTSTQTSIVSDTAVDRYLTEKECKRSLILERGFKSLKQIIDEKARIFWPQGKGKRPNWRAMTRNKRQPKRKTESVIYISIYTY